MGEVRIKRAGLENVVPKRRFKRGPRPGITCAAVTGGQKARNADKSWLPASRKPGVKQKMRMLGKVVAYSIRLALQNHFYTFNNTIRRQAKGGGIGNSLAGEVARLFDIWWDRQFLEKMKTLKIVVDGYQRYVDDDGITMPAINPGVRFEDGKLINKEELIESDLGIKEDKRTAELTAEIANTIHPSIQVKPDYPSNHIGGRMPLLDMQIWVDKDNLIQHVFYEKEVASKFLIPFRSAHSTKQKKLLLINEVERRMVNCSPDLPWSETSKVLNLFSHKMKRSGYPSSWRREAIRSGIAKYRKRQMESQDGGRPLYRPREWMEEERKLAKAKKKVNWARKQADNDELGRAPLIICPSAGNLTDKIKKVCLEFGISQNIKVPVFLRGGRRLLTLV